MHDSRVMKVADSLSKRGCVVHILGLEDGRDLPTSIPCNYHIIKLSSKSWPKYFLVQIVKYFEWLYKILGMLRGKDIDMVICNDLSPLFICVILKYSKRAKLVYDAHELETETHGLLEKPFRKACMKGYEKTFIRTADHVIVVSESIGNWYRSIYGLNNVILLRNTPRASLFWPSTSEIIPDSPMFAFVGALRNGKGVDVACKLFSETTRFSLKVVGDGDLFGALKLEYSGTSNIAFIGHVAEKELSVALKGCSVGLVATVGDCLSRKYSLPNKVFQYLCSGLPVVVPPLPELADLVTKYRIGWVVDLESDGYQFLLTLGAEEIAAKQKNVLHQIEQFSWEYEETKLDALVRL